jgi:hypothetical protein
MRIVVQASSLRLSSWIVVQASSLPVILNCGAGF